MDYVELNIETGSAEQSEILVAELSDFAFESFVTEGERLLKGYIPQERLADCKGEVDALLARYGICGARYISIETQNWNSQWESNFERVEVGSRLLIRAPFHPSDARFAREVVIMPKMSFGTGHHATTHLMAEWTMDLNIAGKRGLDMGSGTGVLAIVAALEGAESVDAVDIDEWAYENCCENIAVNGVEGCVESLLGDSSVVADRSYDFILANINRNILLGELPRYGRMLTSGGDLLISGFLEQDIDVLVAQGEAEGFAFVERRLRDGWVAMRFVRG
ncbi:MAG: 50S ribosomal protein L11 methyltransferase [Rikenellaceae bacterium]